MSARTVIVTRPLAQASSLAEKITAMGHKVVVFPLLEISALPDQAALKAALNKLTSYAMVAFVGPNAIDAAFNHLRQWPDGVSIAILGEGSLKALAVHGVTEENTPIFRPQDAARSDSETLLEAMDLGVLRGKRVLIIRGETGRELLGDALRSAGADVTQVAAYRRTMPVLDYKAQQHLTSLIETRNDWIVTSSEALRNLRQMVASIAGEEGVAKLQRQRFVVSHVRIAENAQNIGLINVTCNGSGDERLLAAIQSHT